MEVWPAIIGLAEVCIFFWSICACVTNIGLPEVCICFGSICIYLFSCCN